MAANQLCGLSFDSWHTRSSLGAGVKVIPHGHWLSLTVIPESFSDFHSNLAAIAVVFLLK
jgi:hypothetical protein